MTTVLLTGFEPFGGDARNPSAEAVHEVAAAWTGPETLITAVLPVAFAASAERLRRLMTDHRPDAVVLTGLAGGRRAVTPERIAVNLVDARIPDNDGAQPIDEPSVPGTPAAAFSTLPVKAIAHDIAAAGIPAEVSHTAGTFVCNHVFFVAAHEARAHPGTRVGFIHLPWSTETAPSPEVPALPASDLARALAIAVRTTLDVRADLGVPGGAIS